MGCVLPQERKAIISIIEETDKQKNSAVIYRRIGPTTYKVRIHFSNTGNDTLYDKILHLIQNGVVTNGVGCGTMNIPQTSQPLEGSSL